MPLETTASRPRLDSLTGLRALAALGVLGLHVYSQSRSGQLGIGRIGWLFAAGGNGVSFFFLLSGFVLTWSWGTSSEARSFYRRRFARIYPAYLLSLATGVLLLHYIVRVSTDKPALIASILMVQDWFPAPRWSQTNGVAWTLSVEAFFYAGYPLYAGRLGKLTSRRRRKLLFLLAAASVAVGVISSVRTSSDHFITPHYTLRVWLGRAPFMRVPEFIVGALLAHEVRSGTWWRVPLRTAGGVAALAYLLACQVPQSGLQVALLEPAFVLLIGAAAQADIVGQASVFRNRLLLELGAASYCIYLFHDEVLLALRTEAPSLHNGMALLVVLAVTAVCIAEAVHHLVEIPLDRILRGDDRVSASLAAASKAGHRSHPLQKE